MSNSQYVLLSRDNHKSLLSIKIKHTVGKWMSRRKEFQEIVAKSGLTSRAVENLWKWYDVKDS